MEALDKEHLKRLVQEHINLYGLECDLNHLDVSGVTDLSCLFEQSTFNGNISEWDVSNVTNMYGLFQISSFNGDITKWNTSKVTNMSRMFNSSFFNGDLSQWDVANVTSMEAMFCSAQSANSLETYPSGTSQKFKI